MKGFIYKATNIADGRVYIGQTIAGLEARKRQHYKDAESGDENYFHQSLLKGDFVWEVIDEFKGEAEYVAHALNVSEEYHILKNRSNEERYGYNSTMGGYSSDKFAEHLKRRLSVIQGRKVIYQYDLDGNFVRVFDSINAVAAEFGKRKLKKDILVGEGKMWHGYQWREGSDNPAVFIEPYKPNDGHSEIFVSVYSTPDGNLVDRCISVTEASKKYNKSRDSILSSSLKIKGYVVTVNECNLQPFIYIRTRDDIPDKITVNVIKPKVREVHPIVRRGIVQFDIYGNEIARYANTTEASGAVGKSPHSINAACKIREPIKAMESRMRYIWRYEDECDHPLSITVVKRYVKPENKIKHSVCQYTKDGEYIATFGNVRMASEATGDSPALIRKLVLGGITSKTKYLWRYE